MTAHLLAFSFASLLAGPFVAVLPYPSLATNAGLAAGAVVVAVAVWRADPPTRRRLLACALLAFGGYAVIAAGRAPVLTSLAMPTSQAAIWPRYHYVGGLALALAVCLLLAALTRRRTAAGFYRAERASR